MSKREYTICPYCGEKHVKETEKKVKWNFRVPEGLDRQLEAVCKEYGFTKTRFVIDAVNMRFRGLED